MPNILVSTFGMSWPIIPELLSFTNPDQVPLLKNSVNNTNHQSLRKRYSIEQVNEVWIITTSGTREKDKLRLWFNHLSPKANLDYKLFISKNIEDLNSVQECEWMTDLIYRTVLHAHEAKGKNGKLYLSLAGGRKTMSADMQQAAQLFGCDALLHIAVPSGSHPPPLTGDNVTSLLEPLPENIATKVHPIVISGKIEAAAFLSIPPAIDSSIFKMEKPLLGEEVFIPSDTRLQDKVKNRQENAQNLLAGFRSDLVDNSMNQNFLGLYGLHPKNILKLKHERIGININSKDEDLAWLISIPKPELHCHLGGILHPEDHVEVATVMYDKVEEARDENYDFDKWLLEIRTVIEEANISRLIEIEPNLRNIRNRFKMNPTVVVCGFLLQFKGYIDILKKYIYHDINIESAFMGIGIDRYEQLGDLQGSALLQSEATIRATLNVLKRKCAQDNIKYLELRCSPCNYCLVELSPAQVVKIIMDELNDDLHTIFRIIFIASRHRKIAILKQHIELYHELKDDRQFQEMFVGFDLAGNESAGKPGDLREYFLEVMEDSINMTIHAGEDQPVRSIWEAVYHLNADRIGHGLTLIHNPNLKARFLNRRIAIEMCPSSNFQVVGFNDQLNQISAEREYPLKSFIDYGLPVTINTDDPGMSLTTLSAEYYKAACMTIGGLTKWEILQIVKNGYEYSFLQYKQKKKLIQEVDEIIIQDLLSQ